VLWLPQRQRHARAMFALWIAKVAAATSDIGIKLWWEN